jgi:hypothetical protein
LSFILSSESCALNSVLNYFNYFTEIEDTFIRRRGKHLLLSPVDWALIESWKEQGVPLHVALRGIEHAFDSHAAKPRRRSVKTLMYCQEEVEAQYAEWLESQTGTGEAEANGHNAGALADESDAHLPFSRAAILAHLAHVREALKALYRERKKAGAGEFYDTLARTITRLESLEKDFAAAARPDAEKLEESLTSLEKMLDQSLISRLSQAKLTAAREETEAQLSSYRSRMDAATYRQTLENLLLKSLRERHGVPRLSLFYL